MYGDSFGNRSRFQRHEPCPACGSKDNLARYEGGSAYCFGCGYFEREHAGTVHSKLQRMAEESMGPTENTGLRSPPDDTDFGGYPELVLEWVRQYGLTAADLIRHKVGWSKKREQLIYHFYGADQDLVLWQARRFRQGTTHKDRFYTCGTPEDVIAAYYPKQTSDTACIVEDCISAIVVSQCGVSGIPCFGATMSGAKIARIAKLWKNIFVWLDADKFIPGSNIARQLSMLGCRTRVYHTKEDPKEYPLDKIDLMMKM